MALYSVKVYAELPLDHLKIIKSELYKNYELSIIKMLLHIRVFKDLLVSVIYVSSIIDIKFIFFEPVLQF